MVTKKARLTNRGRAFLVLLIESRTWRSLRWPGDPYLTDGTVRHLATHEFHHYLIANPPKSQKSEPKSQNPDQQKIIALKFYLCY
jgi:hypothetical protein